MLDLTIFLHVREIAQVKERQSLSLCKLVAAWIHAGVA
jgi:hypothetical protein